MTTGVTPQPVRVSAGDETPDHSSARERASVCFVSLNIYPSLTEETPNTAPGGAEVQQALIGRELVRRGFKISYVTRDHGQGPYEQRDGWHIYGAFRQTAGIPGTRFFYPRVPGILRAMSAADADIYYVRCSGHALAWAVWEAQRKGKKSVYCGANDPDFDRAALRTRHSLRDRALYQWGLKRCDAVVVQNATQQRLLRQQFGRDAEIIHNGFPRFDGPISDGSAILWVATFKEFKQPGLFFELARRLPHEQFVIIGGPCQSSAAEIALYQQLQADSRHLTNLRFLGVQPLEVVEQQLASTRVLVNTSRHEGFPNTFLQAWRRGVPVVSFVDPDDLISRHQLGWKVNNLSEMEAVIRRALTDKQAYDANHIAASFAQHLTIDAAADAYERLFSQLADNVSIN